MAETSILVAETSILTLNKQLGLPRERTKSCARLSRDILPNQNQPHLKNGSFCHLKIIYFYIKNKKKSIYIFVLKKKYKTNRFLT
jgi:hypothetical protein